MTDATRQAIERARTFLRGQGTTWFADARAFAEALVELADQRPNKIDLQRVDRGEYVRAAGDALCPRCELPLYDHPVVPGLEWLHRACDGRLFKL